MSTLFSAENHSFRSSDSRLNHVIGMRNPISQFADFQTINFSASSHWISFRADTHPTPSPKLQLSFLGVVQSDSQLIASIQVNSRITIPLKDPAVEFRAYSRHLFYHSIWQAEKLIWARCLLSGHQYISEGFWSFYPVNLAGRETNLSTVLAFGTPLHLRGVLRHAGAFTYLSLAG